MVSSRGGMVNSYLPAIDKIKVEEVVVFVELLVIVFVVTISVVTIFFYVTTSVWVTGDIVVVTVPNDMVPASAFNIWTPCKF